MLACAPGRVYPGVPVTDNLIINGPPGTQGLTTLRFYRGARRSPGKILTVFQMGFLKLTVPVRFVLPWSPLESTSNQPRLNQQALTSWFSVESTAVDSTEKGMGPLIDSTGHSTAKNDWFNCISMAQTFPTDIATQMCWPCSLRCLLLGYAVLDCKSCLDCAHKWFSCWVIMVHKVVACTAFHSVKFKLLAYASSWNAGCLHGWFSCSC